MKKIFYSIMAVALCACSQSDVDDNVVAPQPENNGLKFTVVDNGFVNEDGTRVTYDGITASFGENDEIGIFAIKTSGNMEDDHANFGPDAGAKVPNANAYIVNNAKLTLSGGVWKLTDKDGNTGVDFGDADLLFAYRPYDPNKTINSASGNDGRPSFIETNGIWDINKGNNRFFVHPWNENWETPTEADFEKADWMGAAANITSETKTVTLNMTHMRGMVELTTNKDVELTDLRVVFADDTDNTATSTKYQFKPYFVNKNVTDRTQNIYRILTTEYRKALTIYATIKDLNIVKKYRKVIDDANYKKAGVRYLVNIDYTPAETTTVDAKNSLASQLGSTQPTKLRLAGTLSDADWATLKGLTALTSLDMYNLTNTEIPNGWLNENKTLTNTLTTLVLPQNLTTIPWNSLQVKNVANIDIPATVKTIGNGAFYYCENTSFCIPANSQLTSIGDGAFWNAKAVYTDALGVLKIPAGVTEILGNAFVGVKNLNKIIFQSTEAPAITNGENQTIENNVLICVPNSDNYKNKSLFPGNAVLVNPLPLTADNYTPISTETSEGSIAKLCDGIISAGNYWHSRWQGDKITYDQWGIYIDIALPTEQTSLKVFYTNRSGGNNFFLKKVAIGVKSAETEDYTELFRVENTETSKPLQEGAGASTVLESAVAKTDGSSYQYVRFAILQANGVVAENAGEQAANAAMATLAELMLAEDAWTE